LLAPLAGRHLYTGSDSGGTPSLPGRFAGQPTAQRREIARKSPIPGLVPALRSAACPRRAGTTVSSDGDPRGGVVAQTEDTMNSVLRKYCGRVVAIGLVVAIGGSLLAPRARGADKGGPQGAVFSVDNESGRARTINVSGV